MTGADLAILIPEIVLTLFTLVALLGAVYTSKDALAPALTWARRWCSWSWPSTFGVTGEGTRVAFGGSFIEDGFARFAQDHHPSVGRRDPGRQHRLHGKVGPAAVRVPDPDHPVGDRHDGHGLVGRPDRAHMGLELQSLALYVIASLRRDSVRSTEAGLKYFILGALSSGLLLYGASLVYGYAGTTVFFGHHRDRDRGRHADRHADRAGVPDCGPGLQGLGRAVPHVDPRCLRGRPDAGHGLPCHRPQGWRRSRCSRAWSTTRSAVRSATGSRSWRCCRAVDVPWRRGRDRPDRHQAPDGLFLDQPHGLCAHGTLPPEPSRASRRC